MDTSVATAQVESPRDLGTDRGAQLAYADSAKKASRWKSEVERAIKYQEKYLKRVDKILARYRVETERGRRADNDNQRRYNVLWSMVNTLQPNLFMKMPKPFISRRVAGSDAIANWASKALENALLYTNDSDDAHDALAAAVDDHILAARGTTWVRYLPTFDLRHSETKTRYEDDKVVPEGAITGEDEEGRYYQAPVDELDNEECETDHIQLVNFVHPAASSFKQLPWVAKRVLMTRDELVKRFTAPYADGKTIGEGVPLGYRADGTKIEKASQPDEADGMFHVAAVYEIWHKTSRKVLWVCLECDYLLDEVDDPLKLKNFFPCPRPLYGTLTNNSLIPVPDFKYYESIANELDDITQRISLLTQALRVVGVYDASLGKLIERVTDEAEENEMIAVEDYSSLTDKGGLKEAIQFLPIEQIMVVISKLYEARTALLAELYEITGMSDIIRGNSDPSETATAQRIKGQYASARLKRRQRAVARFAREQLEIQAEIICTHYSAETILRISGAETFVVGPDGKFSPELWAQVLALLKNEPMRNFRIKIDNETLAGDELQENQQAGMMFVQSVSQMLGQAIPAMEKNPELGRVAKEIVMFAVRLFPVARSVEGQIEQALEKMANTPPPQPPPPPAELSPDQKLQIEMRKLDLEEKRLDLEKRTLEFEQWKGKWELYLNSKKTDVEPKLRNKQIDGTQALGVAKLDQQERDSQRDASLKREQVAVDDFHRNADRAQDDRQESNRREEAGAQFERDTHEKAMDRAASKVERDDERDDRQEDQRARQEDRVDSERARQDERRDRAADRKAKTGS